MRGQGRLGATSAWKVESKNGSLGGYFTKAKYVVQDVSGVLTIRAIVTEEDYNDPEPQLQLFSYLETKLGKTARLVLNCLRYAAVQQFSSVVTCRVWVDDHFTQSQYLARSL